MNTITVSGAYVVGPGDELDFVDNNGFYVNQTGDTSPSLDNYGKILVTDDNGYSITAVANAGYGGLYGGPLTNEVGAEIVVRATNGGNVYAFNSGSWSLNIFNKGLVDVETNSGAAEGFSSWSPGFLVNNSGTLTVSSPGGDAYGTQTINGGSVSNSGTIDVTGLNNAYGVWIDRFEAGSGGGRGNVTNSGSIVATATGGPSALSVGIQATGLPVVYNGQPNTITNTATGTISANIGISVGAPGYPSFQEPFVAIVNAGVIHGDIDTGDAVTTIQNTGQLTGNINIGSATTTVDLRGGTFTGELFIDPSRSPSAINDVVYEQASGGVVSLGGGDSNAHITVNGSSTGGVTIVMMPGSIANASLTPNPDGSFLVSTLTGGSATLINTNEVKFEDGVFFTNVNSGVINAYEVGFGRDPTPAELNYWDTHVTSVAGLPSVMTAILNEPSGQAYTASQITSLYETYFGRAPSAQEVTVWQNDLIGGADYDTVRAILLQAPEGRAHTNAEVTSLYDTYMGRDPTAAELNVWAGLVLGGDDFTAVRSAILSDAAGQAHTNAVVTSLYDDFFGRDPHAAELSVWQGLIAGGDTFSDVEHALLADPASAGPTVQFITDNYEAYFGRAPFSSEVAVWQGLFAGGATPEQFKAALLADPIAQAHVDPVISSDYQTYLGRTPSQDELNVWHGLFANGAGYDQLVDTLLKSNAAIPHDQAYGWYTEINYGTGGSTGYLTVDNFQTSGHDFVLLSQAEFGGINPLDAQHAHQITALDGSIDTLVTLDASHAILFEHTTLASLNASSFDFQ